MLAGYAFICKAKDGVAQVAKDLGLQESLIYSWKAKTATVEMSCLKRKLNAYKRKMPFKKSGRVLHERIEVRYEMLKK